ncbi:MAG: hypothetical protein SW833_27200 [Cyanobacteriota bacterium]|nr:hypothetical protein [Cyanobacteriota bacterium]
MSSLKERQQEKISCEGMSLAVYREVAAHLRSVEGVQVDLMAQTSSQFDYKQSQVEMLRVSYPSDLGDRDRALFEAILDYYAQHHGSWQRK